MTAAASGRGHLMIAKSITVAVVSIEYLRYQRGESDNSGTERWASQAMARNYLVVSREHPSEAGLLMVV